MAYLEMEDQPGMMFELIESLITRQLIKDGIAATKSWNGKNPIHIIDLATS